MNNPQNKICPYLGKSKTNPGQVLCGKLKPPSPIRTSYVKEYCVADYEACSIYQGAPGRQSGDEKSPLVVVPVAPAQRSKVEDPSPAPAGKMPVVEFMAYEETDAPAVEGEASKNGWLWVLMMGAGIVIVLILIALIVIQFAQ